MSAGVRAALLLFVSLTGGRLAAQDVPTYSRDIAPIVFAKCSACHHPGGAAPFSVLTYAAARPFATQIEAAVRRGDMPPWKAEPTVEGGFLGQARLTEAERAVIARWVAGGAPEGDAADLPRPPQWRDEWQLGFPDLTVQTPRYELSAEGTDVFRIFVVPLPTDRVRYVRGLEFRPGNPRIVHHANIRIDTSRASRRFDDADPAPGYEGLIAHSASYPDGHFLGWTPGQVAPLLPKGLAWRLEPGTDLVVELHMQPNGKVEDVVASIGLYFGDDPPERTPAMLRLGRQGIDIAPGERRYTITDSFVLPVDVDVQAVQPHAHWRAVETSGMATLPDGSTRSLIEIKAWDFRWQHVYRYAQPLHLPKGTTLSMRFVYDNGAENPRNPVQPPRRVYWGQRSADEMGDLWIQVLTRDDRDLALLNTQFGAKVMAEDVIGYERWIQSEPKTTSLRDDVGILYLKLNRPADAVRHFAVSAVYQPQSAPAHFNLGIALAMSGELPAAITEFDKALALKPDYGAAHNNLGSLLLRSGRLSEAVAHLEQATALEPDNPQAHYNLATARALTGQSAKAVASFRQALRAMPDQPAVLVDLAWLLAASRDATLRDPAAAVNAAQRAVLLTGQRDAGALDALGAAFASAGDFRQALAAVDAALGLTPGVRELVDRRGLYEQSQVFQFSDR